MTQSLLVSSGNHWSPRSASLHQALHSHLSPLQMLQRDPELPQAPEQTTQVEVPPRVPAAKGAEGLTKITEDENPPAPPRPETADSSANNLSKTPTTAPGGDSESPEERDSGDKRPSLFGHNSNSQSTLFSHTSKVSANVEESDSEDISDISEEEDDFYDSESDTGAHSALADTSAVRDSGGYFSRKPSKSPSLVRGFNPSDSVSIDASGSPKYGNQLSTGQLVNTRALRQNIFFIANSPSPPQESERSAKGHLSSLFRRQKRAENGSVLSRPEDDSEWVSVSSEEEHVSDSRRSLNFHKRDLSASHMSSLTDVSHRSTDTIPPPLLAKPRSLLSGLFLSEMGAPPEKRVPKAKPTLKRASTTGIITIDQGNDRNSSSTRPSILFSKKYNSLLNISKNYPHFHNSNVKNNILNDYSGDNDEEDQIIGKQKLIVGISDFNVTRSSNSINSNERRDGIAASPHDALSSSLTKYSGSLHGHSLKNILSKSTLSLSGLFSTRQRKSGSFDRLRRTPSDPVAEHGDALSPVETAQEVGNSDNSPVTDSSAKCSPVTLESKVPTSPRAAGIRLSPKLTRRSMLSTELSKSLKDSIIIDYKLGKVPLARKVVKSQNVEVKDDYIENDYHSKGW